jgi:hypothetical protein
LGFRHGDGFLISQKLNFSETLATGSYGPKNGRSVIQEEKLEDVVFTDMDLSDSW